MLCDECKLAVAGKSKVYREPPEREIIVTTEFLHHRTLASFHQANEMGCFICSLLWHHHHRADAHDSSDKDHDPPTTSTECFVTYSFRTLEGFVEDSKDPDINVFWQFTVYPEPVPFQPWLNRLKFFAFGIFLDKSITYDPDFPPTRVNTFSSLAGEQASRQIGHEIGPTTDTKSSMSIIRHWLTDCQNHQSCKNESGLQHPLPKRVIDVGDIGEPLVKLFVRQSPHQRARYITLSHKWGAADVLKLTNQNYKTLRAGIRVSDLPKTFRHAIQVTRELEIRYLWIDSLCILQDSVEDWREQSSLMGDIYYYCFCNIAATSSLDSNGGLFVARDVNLAKPLQIALRWREKSEMPFSEGIYYIYYASQWRDMVENAPLNQRGWVLQERILAPRVVHFNQRIFWECQSTTGCEIAPTVPNIIADGRELFYKLRNLRLGMNSKIQKAKNNNKFGRELFYKLRDLRLGMNSKIQKAKNNNKFVDPTAGHDSFDSQTGPYRYSSLYRSWWDLVRKYSNCKLSKDEDIFPALSGIAKIFEQALGDKYVAGHWRKPLLFDLLWCPVDVDILASESLSTRPVPSRAPSWSWASLKGQVYPKNSSGGAYEMGNPLIVTEVLDIAIRAAGNDETGQIDAGHLTLRIGIFEVVLSGQTFGDRLLRQFTVNIGSNIIIGKIYLDEHDSEPARGSTVICAPILLLKDWGRFEGLVLKPVPHARGQYIRVGILYTYAPQALSTSSPTESDFIDMLPVGSESTEGDYRGLISDYEKVERKIIKII
jgi:hypothetical protein